MLFDDGDISGRRLFSRRKHLKQRPTLSVNVRLHDKETTVKRTAFSVLAIVGILIVLGLVGLGVWMAGRALYWNNPRFAIKKLDIQEGSVITEEMVKGFTKIDKGTNLFEVDIEKTRESFLKNAHFVEDMQIVRVLPDKLKIQIKERVPKARMGSRGQLVADGQGCCFWMNSGASTLPVILGYKDPNLRPGSRLTGAALPALRVVDACENPQLGLRIETIDISRSEYLLVVLSDQKSVRLSWDRMAEDSAEARNRMRDRLQWVSQVLLSDRGRELTRLDATHSDGVHAVPEW